MTQSKTTSLGGPPQPTALVHHPLVAVVILASAWLLSAHVEMLGQVPHGTEVIRHPVDVMSLRGVHDLSLRLR